jgi:hypothetical protein
VKSWDGNNRTYGPDRWHLRIQGGPTLLETTFSNNPKAGADLSRQNYPVANSPQQSGAASVNTLGYRFYGDSTYHLSFNFPHAGDTLMLNFSSSLFEGTGTDDESWGLDKAHLETVVWARDKPQRTLSYRRSRSLSCTSSIGGDSLTEATSKAGAPEAAGHVPWPTQGKWPLSGDGLSNTNRTQNAPVPPCRSREDGPSKTRRKRPSPREGYSALYSWQVPV